MPWIDAATGQGIEPHEALLRLRRFEELQAQLEQERVTLTAAEHLLGLPETLFPELQYTGQQVRHLWNLYSLFERFLQHRQKLLDSLWATADLGAIVEELEDLQATHAGLAADLRRWPAHLEMAETLAEENEVRGVRRSPEIYTPGEDGEKRQGLQGEDGRGLRSTLCTVSTCVLGGCPRV